MPTTHYYGAQFSSPAFTPDRVIVDTAPTGRDVELAIDHTMLDSKASLIESVMAIKAYLVQGDWPALILIPQGPLGGWIPVLQP